MANTYFQFKQFVVHQDQCAMKVSTDACLFGAWVSRALVGRAPLRVLDIGAGTGLLSLMIAQQNPSADITGVELQASSAEQGASNMASSPWGERLHMITGDINHSVFSSGFDVIVSNPPFFEGDLRGERVDRNLARHADTLTLVQLIGIIQRNLTLYGLAALLLPFHRMDEALDLAGSVGLYCREKVLVRQTGGHGAFRCMLLVQRGVGECRKSELVVKEGEGYSLGFVELLKGYYLYL